MTGWSVRSRVRRRTVALGDAHLEKVAARRAAAIRLVGAGEPVSSRIANAPAGYLLAHTSSDIARHCTLLAPVPATGEVRVVITPGRVRHHWHLDVASRDRLGLLAAFTGALARHGVDVVQAVLATWDDGGALEAFVVRAPEPPDATSLQHALATALDEPLSSDPVADAAVVFNNDGPGAYTRCDVVAADRPGLLHTVAVAIASGGADVHAAHVATVDGTARDRFDISDRDGHRIDATVEAAIRAGVHDGVTGRRRPRSQR